MGAADYVRRFLARGPAVAPRTFPSSQKKTISQLFSKRDRDLKKLATLETIYLQGGPVSEAIDSYALLALSNGYYFDGDETLVKDVEAAAQELDLHGSLWQQITGSLSMGDDFQELAPGSGDRSGDVVMIIPRPSKMFDVEADEYGIKTGYRQFIGETWDQRSIPLRLDQMIHTQLFTFSGSKYGLSLIDRALDDIYRDTRMITSLTDAIERMGHPRYHGRVGAENEDVPQPVLDRVADQLNDLNSCTQLATCRDVEIVELNTAGVGNADTYSNLTIQRLACALGVPEEVLGLGRGSTEATAKVRQAMFEMKVSTIQGKLERSNDRQFVDRITKQPGKVHLHFNDISEEDELTVAQYVTAVLAADPLRPLASRQWAQKRLKLQGEDIPEGDAEVDDILGGIDGLSG